MNVLLIVLSLIAKVGYFYMSTDMPIGKIAYSAVTVSVFLFLMLVLQKKPKWYVGIATLISLIMYGDLLYFRYFRDFLSVKLIHQATFVGSVMDIVVSLVSIFDVLLLMDIAVYVLLRKKFPQLRFYKRKSAFILTLCVLPVVILGISFAEIYTGIKKYEFFNYHVYDIVQADFQDMSLKADELDELVALIKETNNTNPQSDYFGAAKGRRVILIQMESFQSSVIQKRYEGQEITPHMNALIESDSLYFSNYYQQLGKGNTSDAEFVTLNSLYPVTSGNAYHVYEKNRFYGLPWILREHGYSATSYHGFQASFWNRENIYPQIGFEESYFEHNYVMGEKMGFGLNDMDFFMQSADYMALADQKSFHFLITLTSHKPYKMPDSAKYLPVVKGDGSLFENYLQSVAYTDHALGLFIEKLKELNLYEDSIIILYGDHYGIGMEQKEAVSEMETFLDKPYTYEEMMRIPLIIHIPGLGSSETFPITGGQIDLMPTVLNLMGIENHYVSFGRDLVNSEEGFVASQTFLPLGSFIDDEVVLDIGRSGDGSDAHAFLRDDYEVIAPDALLEKSELAERVITLSKKVTETNALYLLLELVQEEDPNFMRE